MQLQVKNAVQLYGFASDCGTLVGRKNPTPLLRGFKAFVNKRPNYYNPISRKPYVEIDKGLVSYNLICFLHYFVNRDLLDSGSRSVKLEDDIDGLKTMFQIAIGG